MSDAPKKKAIRADEAAPHFAREFPADPRLQDLVAAFSRGDYHAVNEGADALAASTKDEAVKAAARDLKARTRPHPLAKYVFLLAAILLAVLTSYWISESHKPHVEPKTATAPSGPAQKPEVLQSTPKKNGETP